MPLARRRHTRTPLVTVELAVSGCPTEAELRHVGGALACIRGVAVAEPASDPGHIVVSYEPDKVVPLQFQRAVRAMGGCLEGIVLTHGTPVPTRAASNP
jgi:hypothetical protein